MLWQTSFGEPEYILNSHATINVINLVRGRVSGHDISTDWERDTDRTPILIPPLPNSPVLLNQRHEILHYYIEPFMEWKIHMDNGMEWIMGGNGEIFGEIMEWDG